MSNWEGHPDAPEARDIQNIQYAHILAISLDTRVQLGKRDSSIRFKCLFLPGLVTLLSCALGNFQKHGKNKEHSLCLYPSVITVYFSKLIAQVVSFTEN